MRPAWAASAERRMDAEAIRDDIGLSCFALSYGLRYVLTNKYSEESTKRNSFYARDGPRFELAKL